ncbi:unnamed protein product [Clonostachys solani]|uniref:FAD-binding PCMH-type domain-containing protein n=1 Tax=Clonostachys solani TaxID=160281 RepID=A0A9P0ES26_9HYPO|nr:unnamed protein product [Clonostachys solani]
MTPTLSGLDSIKCEFAVPGPGTPLNGVVRWSDTNIDQPSLIVKPTTEDDVQTSIKIAKSNGLTITVGGGGHGTFVTLDSNALYLDMANFKAIKLDKSTGIVEIGGGVTTGEALKALADQGYYTPLPNSNAVGVVGCIIGGGNTPLIGTHGWMADLVESFRLATAEGKMIEVSSSSTGEDLALFNALCGAGHGLGVITAVKTSAFPIKDLNMTDDKIWIRSLVFPPTAIEIAAEAFLKMQRPASSASINVLFMRSPPGTPAAGSPIIVLGATVFASAEQGEGHASILFDDELVGKAIVKNTEATPIVNLNDRYAPYDSRGGHKAIASCRLNNLDISSIKSAFEQWVSVTEKYPDSRRSILVVGLSDSTKAVQLGNSGATDRFVEGREREFSIMTVTICSEDNTRVALVEYMDTLMKRFREGDLESVPRSFPNNLRFGMNLEELFSRERLSQLRDLKDRWDVDGLFWNPYKQ